MPGRQPWSDLPVRRVRPLRDHGAPGLAEEIRVPDERGEGDTTARAKAWVVRHVVTGKCCMDKNKKSDEVKKLRKHLENVLWAFDVCALTESVTGTDADKAYRLVSDAEQFLAEVSVPKGSEP